MLNINIDIIEKNLKEEVYIEFPIEEDKDLLDLFLNMEKLSEGRNFNLKLYTKDNKFININLNNLIEFRSRLSGFLDKPLNKKIESILGIFSVSFFVYSNIGVHLLLKNNDYISENNVATQKFKSEFLRNYKIGDETFFYVNVPELIKKIKEISNEAMII